MRTRLVWPDFTTVPDGQCWVWQGPRDRNGYGKFGHKFAHIVSYMIAVGPVPDGLELDHTCRNRACANPSHLEPVTHAENVRRGNAPGARAARTGRCMRGHLFDAANTYRPPNDPAHRVCRICRRSADARARAKRRQEVAA